MRQTIAQKTSGYTLVELLVVIFVIGILAVLVVNYVAGWREKSYQTKADSDLATMNNAIRLYANKYNSYPDEINRDIPAGLKEFLSPDTTANLPNGPWSGSTYDYDKFDNSGETIQISIRFCPGGGPLSACKFPNQPWSSGFQVDSSYYYCFKGNCKASPTQPDNYPGYCVNCPNHKAIKG